MATVPVFWITGAAGAGKSAAAWSLVERLSRRGLVSAYVDIDQLGMLYPDVDEDPWAHALKARVLDALLPGYREHGAQVVVVSGVVDPRLGPRPHLTHAGGLTLVALVPEVDVVRARLSARGWDADAIHEVAQESRDLARGELVDLVVETDGLSIGQTSSLLVPAVATAGRTPALPRPAVGSSATIPVVAVTGPRLAGSSTVGFTFASRRWQDEQPTAFVDSEQLGFLSPAVVDTAALAAGQLARVHESMAARGAELMIVCGRPDVVSPTSLAAVFPAAPSVVVRLRADQAAFADRARLRAADSNARLAGDDLLGADAAHQAAVVRQALDEQTLLDSAARGDEVLLQTSGLSVDDVVADIEVRARQRSLLPRAR